MRAATYDEVLSLYAGSAETKVVVVVVHFRV